MAWYVKYLRIYCHREEPNEQWDGFRIALFAFQNGVPGEMMWPQSGEPKWVRPEIGYQAGWYDFPVDWYLPVNSFVAAWEQFYDPPDCDAISFDDGGWCCERTWRRGEGVWSKMDCSANLMVRVYAELMGGVAPASLGRVKALYR
jgi:hypothetical protein